MCYSLTAAFPAHTKPHHTSPRCPSTNRHSGATPAHAAATSANTVNSPTPGDSAQSSAATAASRPRTATARERQQPPHVLQPSTRKTRKSLNAGHDASAAALRFQLQSPNAAPQSASDRSPADSRSASTDRRQPATRRRTPARKRESGAASPHPTSYRSARKPERTGCPRTHRNRTPRLLTRPARPAPHHGPASRSRCSKPVDSLTPLRAEATFPPGV
jgi:hypothetical protein